MASSSDGPGKGPQKPTPIIDLKATEVKVDDASKAGASSAAKPTGASTSGLKGAPDYGASAAKPDAGKIEPGRTEPAKPATTATPGASSAGASAKPMGAASASSFPSAGAAPAGTAGKGADTKASDTKPADAKAQNGKTSTASPPASAAPAARADAPRRSGGIVSTLTHLVAGLAGGVLALFGAETIQKSLGVPINLPRSQNEAIAPEVAKRLAALESQARTAPVASDAVQKIAANERRLTALDDLAKTVADLKAQQAAIETETKKLQAVPGGAAAAADPALKERLAKLEETLATLSRAAGSDGQGGGRIAQLAAITGKVADLESSLTNQTAALRKTLLAELEARIAQSAEASEAAKAGTARIDRDVASLKTESARISQRAETLKATDERLETTLRAVQEETASIKSAVDGLKGDLAQQLKSVARPKDVSTALAPVTAKITTIEKDLAGVVKSEADRKINAERVVLALELANLKRVVDRGSGYAKELAELKASAGAKLDLSALDRFKDKGVATTAELITGFRGLAHRIILAAAEDKDASVVDRLLSGARSIVKVRSTNPADTDKSTEATVARIEARLKEGSLAAVMEEAGKLPEKAREPAKSWLETVNARAEIERAISRIEGQLKSSISGGAGEKAKG